MQLEMLPFRRDKKSYQLLVFKELIKSDARTTGEGTAHSSVVLQPLNIELAEIWHWVPDRYFVMTLEFFLILTVCFNIRAMEKLRM